MSSVLPLYPCPSVQGRRRRTDALAFVCPPPEKYAIICLRFVQMLRAAWSARNHQLSSLAPMSSAPFHTQATELREASAAQPAPAPLTPAPPRPREHIKLTAEPPHRLFFLQAAPSTPRYPPSPSSLPRNVTSKIHDGSQPPDYGSAQIFNCISGSKGRGVAV